MIRLSFIITAILASVNCHGQVNIDSLAGSYVFKSYTGGGFTGGPNGSCVSLPPDCKITNRLTILPDLTVFSVSDTVRYGSLHIHWGCDTLYLGKAKLRADTLVISYTRKPVCPYYSFTTTKQQPKRYKKLEAPIIEKYIIQLEGGRIQGLKKWDDVGEVYEKEQAYETN
jgi:hypothetical protein